MEQSTESLLPQLSPEEIRVLGALIEKSKATPEYYPLTINSLVTACNQKSSRNPVVNYEQDTVLIALDKLKKKGLAATVTGDGRTIKYRHTIAVKYPLDPAEVTALCLLFLRGPLTIGEIKTTAGRMYDFDNLDEVQSVLTNLAGYETPFVQQLERKPGQKESRFYHLFADAPEMSEESTAGSSSNSELEERVANLETEVAELRRIIDEFLNS
jgi:uncharacterized protein YceH (UPF0502 family)